MDGISRSRGWDKEVPHGVLPMEQLVLSDKWARNLCPPLLASRHDLADFLQFTQLAIKISMLLYQHNICFSSPEPKA